LAKATDGTLPANGSQTPICGQDTQREALYQAAEADEKHDRLKTGNQVANLHWTKCYLGTSLDQVTLDVLMVVLAADAGTRCWWVCCHKLVQNNNKDLRQFVQETFKLCENVALREAERTVAPIPIPIPKIRRARKTMQNT
jgi:hypothetical protein